MLSRIARGGMATVYLCRDRRLDREVAVKIMHAHLAEGTSGADFVARFRREARSAARLDHPGLVAVLDQGVDEDISYLVMEYVDGTDLRRRLRAEGSLSVGDALSTTEAVLDALASAHQAGYVHRDIKPENVLLARHGRVKVADFGLARAVTEVTAATTGSLLGTVAYLAPELVSHGTSDTRTDVYAVGILLYEMLTGRQPYSGDSAIHIAYQHVHARVPAPSDLVDWLPAELDDLVAHLTAREVDERPENAARAVELVRLARAALDEETLDRRADVVPAAPEPAAAEDPAPAETPVENKTEVDPDATQALPVVRDQAPPDDDEPDALGRTISLKIGAGLVDPTARRRRVIRLGLIVGVVVALLSLGGWWYASSGPGAYTSVPSGLLGQTVAEASAVLEQHGLGATSTTAFDPTVPDGAIVSATPEEGERIRKDGSVDLVVSKGPDLREVPADLAGAKLDDVVAALTAADFTVPDPKHSFDDVVAEGIVLSIDPPSGASQPVGTPITVTVSDGPEPLTVISVVGRDAAEAKKALEDQGLRVTEQQDYSEEYPEGQVMAQDPAASAEGHRTDPITITISQGPPLVEVPDIPYGAAVRDATSDLEKAGFVVKVERAGAFFQLNRVIAQSPEGGSQAPKGSTVVITIT